jgi:hypothetical protein
MQRTHPSAFRHLLFQLTQSGVLDYALSAALSDMMGADDVVAPQQVGGANLLIYCLLYLW